MKKITSQMQFGKRLFYLSLFADILYQPTGDNIDKVIMFFMVVSICVYTLPIFRFFQETIYDRDLIKGKYEEFLKEKGMKETTEKTEGDA